MPGNRPNAAQLVEWALVVAPLPLVLVQFRRLVAQPDFFFLPLFGLILAILAWRRWPPSDLPGATRRGYWWRGLSIVFLVPAVLLLSPSWGTVACLGALGSIAVRRSHGSTRRRLTPVWAALWLTAIPADGARRLSDWSAWFAWRSADAMLDRLGYLHWMIGSYVETPDRRFVLDERLWDNVSLLAVAAFAALVAIHRRRSFLPAFLSVLAAPVWHVAVRAFVYVLVPVAFARWQVDLSQPAPWLGVSALTIAGLAILVVSTDRAFTLFGFASPLLSWATRTISRPFRHLWNRWHPRRTPSIPTPKDVAHTDSDESEEGRGVVWTGPRTATVAGCVAIGLLQIVCLATNGNSEPRSGRSIPTIPVEFDRWIPEKLGEWTRQNPSVENRENVRIWGYSSGSSQFTLRLALLDATRPDGTERMRAEGWRVSRTADGRSIAPLRAVARDRELVEWTKSSGESAVRISAVLDGAGRPMSRWARALVSGLRRGPLGWAFSGGPSSADGSARWLPAFECVLFAAAPERVDREVRTALQSHFAEIVDQLAEARKGSDER